MLAKYRTTVNLRRSRLSSAEKQTTTEHRQQQQQQQQQQQVPFWQRFLGLRPSPGQQVPAERWEQPPQSIRLMNEICDAIGIGSDFAFWTGLVIILILLAGLMIWYP